MNPRDQRILDQAKSAHERANIKRLWEMDYAHDRRAHRHKCQCCGRIVKEGERVFMYRLGIKTTRVVHVIEADRKIFQDAGYSFLDLALTHAYSHAIQ